VQKKPRIKYPGRSPKLFGKEIQRYRSRLAQLRREGLRDPADSSYKQVALLMDLGVGKKKALAFTKNQAISEISRRLSKKHKRWNNT
jgi:hypothetical protein